MSEPFIQIDLERSLAPIEEPTEIDNKLNPQFGWSHEYLEDTPGKTRDHDVEFLSDSDDSGYTPQRIEHPKNAPDYSMDGRIQPEYAQTEDYKHDAPTSYNYDADMPLLRNQLDYGEWNGNYISASIDKKAYFEPDVDLKIGDWVEILRYPGRCPELPIKRRERVGVIIDTMSNGWIVVENLRKQWIPAFAGGSDLDRGVIKIDVSKLDITPKKKKNSPVLAKKASFFNLKQVLNQLGLNIAQPVFHTTSVRNSHYILREGFKARIEDSRRDAPENNAVCFTRNLCFSYKFQAGEVIFVLDLNELKQRFKSYPVDVYHELYDNQAMDTKDPAYFQSEERVSRSPKDVSNSGERETVLSAKYIKLVIVKKDARQHYVDDLINYYGKAVVLRDENNKYSIAAPSGKQAKNKYAFDDAGVPGDLIRRMLESIQENPEMFQGTDYIPDDDKFLYLEQAQDTEN